MAYPGRHSLEAPKEPTFSETTLADGSVEGVVIIHEATLFINGCNTGDASDIKLSYQGKLPQAGDFEPKELVTSMLLPTIWSQGLGPDVPKSFQTAEELRENSTYDDCFYTPWREKIPNLDIPNAFD